MDNREFGKNLERRTRNFGVRIIRLSSQLPNTLEALIIRGQLTKAGTSIGANYREARRTGPEAGPISKAGSRFVRVKPVKPNIGWKSSLNPGGSP